VLYRILEKIVEKIIDLLSPTTKNLQPDFITDLASGSFKLAKAAGEKKKTTKKATTCSQTKG
jgi:hypothetical protein